MHAAEASACSALQLGSAAARLARMACDPLRDLSKTQSELCVIYQKYMGRPISNLSEIYAVRTMCHLSEIYGQGYNLSLRYGPHECVIALDFA